MSFIEWERFLDKRTNLFIYETLPIDLIGNESWCHLLKNFSRLRKGTWPFLKCSLSLLLTRSRNGIYWMEIFHEKKRNLTVYERFPLDFVCRNSWWHLLNENSSKIGETNLPFTKCSQSILFTPSLDDIYCIGTLPTSEKNLTFYAWTSIFLIGRELWLH
jgi:hypothetical protein